MLFGFFIKQDAYEYLMSILWVVGKWNVEGFNNFKNILTQFLKGMYDDAFF